MQVGTLTTHCPLTAGANTRVKPRCGRLFDCSDRPFCEKCASRTDTYFAKVNKDFTSQICPNCGTHTGKKELNVRMHHCSECGYEQNRDVAAAEIVRNRGLTAVGTPVVKLPCNGVLSGAIA